MTRQRSVEPSRRGSANGTVPARMVENTPTSLRSQIVDRDEIEIAVRAERLSLCDFLEGINDGEWAAKSLCSARSSLAIRTR